MGVYAAGQCWQSIWWQHWCISPRSLSSQCGLCVTKWKSSVVRKLLITLRNLAYNSHQLSFPFCLSFSLPKRESTSQTCIFIKTLLFKTELKVNLTYALFKARLWYWGFLTEMHVWEAPGLYGTSCVRVCKHMSVVIAWVIDLQMVILWMRYCFNTGFDTLGLYSLYLSKQSNSSAEQLQFSAGKRGFWCELLVQVALLK